MGVSVVSERARGPAQERERKVRHAVAEGWAGDRGHCFWEDEEQSLRSGCRPEVHSDTPVGRAKSADTRSHQ